jgi:hypothetical protein
MSKLQNGRGYSHGNGRVYKVAIERYIYFHSQCDGYQARRVMSKHGRIVADISKYFGIRRYGSRRDAAMAARAWKNRHLTRNSR